jgi:hypothetical protein
MHDSVLKLLDEVEQPTEQRQPQSPSTSSTSDAAPEPTKETKAETVEPVVEISEDMLDNGADLTIGLYGMAQNSLLSFLAKRKRNNDLVDLYGEDAPRKMKLLLNEQSSLENKLAEKTVRQFTDDELGMLLLEKDFQELMDDLPLSDTEKESIKVPLKQIMKTKGGTLPPEYALIIAVMLITGSRLGQIYI